MDIHKTQNLKKCELHGDPLQFYKQQNDKFICAMCLFEQNLQPSQLKKTIEICEKEFAEWDKIKVSLDGIVQFKTEYNDAHNMMVKIFNLSLNPNNNNQPQNQPLGGNAGGLFGGGAGNINLFIAQPGNRGQAVGGNQQAVDRYGRPVNQNQGQIQQNQQQPIEVISEQQKKFKEIIKLIESTSKKFNDQYVKVQNLRQNELDPKQLLDLENQKYNMILDIQQVEQEIGLFEVNLDFLVETDPSYLQKENQTIRNVQNFQQQAMINIHLMKKTNQVQNSLLQKIRAVQGGDGNNNLGGAGGQNGPSALEFQQLKQKFEASQLKQASMQNEINVLNSQIKKLSSLFEGIIGGPSGNNDLNMGRGPNVQNQVDRPEQQNLGPDMLFNQRMSGMNINGNPFVAQHEMIKSSLQDEQQQNYQQPNMDFFKKIKSQDKEILKKCSRI
eukprot:403358525